MSNRFILLCILISSSIFYYHYAVYAKESAVVINEIAWMGTSSSANDEWIELLNTTDQTINVSGWTIKSSDDKLKISLKGEIGAGNFYLLERTNDTSLPDIKADLIYKGALNNGGMDIKLYDTLGNVIDEATSPSSWLAGDNVTKRTMERTNNSLWQTSKDLGGTPRAKNSTGYIKTESKASVSKEKVLTESKKTGNKNNVAFTTAAIDSDNKNTPFIIFLISLLLILVSGGIILFLKFKRTKRV